MSARKDARDLPPEPLVRLLRQEITDANAAIDILVKRVAKLTALGNAMSEAIADYFPDKTRWHAPLIYDAKHAWDAEVGR